MREWTDAHVLELINETAIKKKIDPYEQAFNEFLRKQSGIVIRKKIWLPVVIVDSKAKKGDFMWQLQLSIDEHISIGQTGTIKGTLNIQLGGPRSMPEGAYLGTVVMGWEPFPIGLSLVQFDIPKATNRTNRFKKLVDYPSIIIDEGVLRNAGLNPIPSEVEVIQKGLEYGHAHERNVKRQGYDTFVPKKLHDETIIPGKVIFSLDTQIQLGPPIRNYGLYPKSGPRIEAEKAAKKDAENKKQRGDN